MRKYQICNRCIMDTTDPEIQFDEDGICNHCHTRDEKVKREVFSGTQAGLMLEQMVDRIKRDGKASEYDCIIGLSGGVDSSYIAYMVKQLGLRALAVHLDNGWDSELAVKNIERILGELGIDLYTYVINWEEFRDIQLSFLKASTPDSEIPSDHAIVSTVVRISWERGIKHIIWGMNAQTETHLPRCWSQGHMDWRYIKSVHRIFGTIPLRTFPHLNFFDYHKFLLQKDRSHCMLNLLGYNKKEALSTLETKLGWQYYGGKHYESIYTRFYQGYILPKKFGYDKRRTHLSSLICSGEITRKEALDEMKKEPYPIELQLEDKEYVIKKLGLTSEEFEAIMNTPPKSYWDYPSYDSFYRSSFYQITKSMYKMLQGK